MSNVCAGAVPLASVSDIVRVEEDLQASSPEIALALSRAGVTGVQKAVRIRRGDAETVMAAVIDCTVDLAADQKGVHMSRFPELFEEAIELVVEREALLVEVLAEHAAADGGPLGVVRIAELVGREKSQVSRTLRTLAETGFVERDPATRGYRIGWRLFAVGAITATLILGGFVYMHDHFSLYMGVVGGGALIAGGLWLRKV